MKIKVLSTFSNDLADQIDYISKDKPNAARKFKSDIIKSIKGIPENPYRYRKSIYFEDNNIREIVFKGYKIVFRIKNNSIEVFGFIKQQSHL
jgi:plasmid stabilization system protein ParE